MKLIKSIFLLTVFAVVSCSPKETKEEVKAEKHDSLVEKINSPELKAINELLLKDPQDDSLYNKRARIYISLKQMDEAMGDVNRAMKIDSTKGSYYVTLADIYFASN